MQKVCLTISEKYAFYRVAQKPGLILIKDVSRNYDYVVY